MELSDQMGRKHELALVMPVYNEEECVAEVLRAWHGELSRLGIDFRMIVLNDGSTDRTKEKLAAFASNPHIQIITKRNSGHGPTILQGYHMAVLSAHWVFQTDSDDEISPDHFSSLWSKRHDFDAIFGVRTGRNQNIGRKFISFVSRLTVRLLFGAGCRDVNVPYRLIRTTILQDILEKIPDDTFAPNVIISGALGLCHARILNVPVPFRGRRTGAVSIVKWKLWRAAFLALAQTVKAAVRFRRRSKG